VADVVDRLESELSDRYTFEEELGQGGMAVVYLAHDVKHQRKVALKVLRPELAAVLGTERFLNEIRVTANLHHPNILPLFDSGAAGEFLYYVMPYVGGETLRAKLNRERQLTVDEALAVTTDIAAALDYAHREGVIHRDIKPENVLFHEGRALVLDFGIALAVTAAGGERLTETGLSLGTPAYMSPEQATGDRNIDARSDVYSLACVLFEMLAGDPPFSGSNIQAVIAQVLTEKPPRVRIRRDTVPVHVEAALDRALSKVPADRYESPREFVQALSVPGPVAPSAVSVWPRRLGVMALGATLVAIGWTLVSRSAGPIPQLSETIHVTYLPGLESDPTWAPDGQSIVYTSSDGGHLGLWMRQIAGGQAHRIGLEGVDEAQAAFSPDGSRIAFVSSRNTTGRLGLFRGGREMESFAYGANGDLMVMPAYGGTAVKVADDAYDPSWSSDGQRIAFRSARNGNWRLYTVTVGDQEVEMVEGVEPRVVGLSWSPDGEWIAYTAGESTASGWDLYVVPAGGGSPVQLTFDSATVALRPSWSPAGDWIAFSSTRGGSLNVWAVPFESDPPGLAGPPEPLTRGIGEDVGVAVAPFGTAVAYATLHTAPDVWMLDTASGALSQLTSETTTEDYPRVSPDGSRLLFFSNRGGQEQLWVQDLATGGLEQVSRGNARQSAWSPDGNSVAYGTDHGLFVQDLMTGEVMVVRPDLLASGPVFSPDGREVAFHGRLQQKSGDLYFPVRRSQLYRFDVEDVNTLRLIPTPEGDPSDPSWGAEGETIFFGVDRPGGVSLWVVDLPTAELRQIPTQVADARHATVSPDGLSILFVHEHRDLYVMPVSGGIPRLLHASIEPNRTIDFPSWTSDGRIVFSRRDKSGDLYLLQAEEQ